MTGAHASATEPGTPGPGAAGAGATGAGATGTGATDKIGEPGEPGQRARAPEPRSVLFTPLTFPLTVGGTTFAFGVAASASAPGVQEKALVSAAAIGYALVTGVTLYAAGHVQRRISSRAVLLLDRIAGVLLTAIAVILLVNGFTELVLSRLGR